MAVLHLKAKELVWVRRQRRSGVEVHRFVGGATQRARTGAPLRSWDVLAYVEGAVASYWRDRFDELQGPVQAFEFEDPESREVSANCHFEEGGVAVEASDRGPDVRLRLRIRQERA